MKSVSIVTVTFNSENTIEDTIRSVLSQTYENIEYIIKDGGSTDNTLSICQQYQPLFGGRMKIISSKDDGIYDAMNQGISSSSGDVVGFLNSDDIYVDSFVVQKLMSCLTQNDADAVYGDVLYVSKDLLIPKRYYSSSGFKLWKMRLGFMPAHPSFYCKRQIYDMYGMYNTHYKIASDFDCLLRFLFVSKINALYCPFLVVKMRIGGASNGRLSIHKQIICEQTQSLRSHNIISSPVLLCMRYPIKLLDIFRTKFFHQCYDIN